MDRQRKKQKKGVTFTHDTKGPEKGPTQGLPGELRNSFWGHVLSTVPGIKQDSGDGMLRLELDAENDTVNFTKAAFAQSDHFDRVEEDGYAFLYKTSLVQVTQAWDEFFSEASRDIVLCFETSDSLRRFAKLATLTQGIRPSRFRLAIAYFTPAVIGTFRYGSASVVHGVPEQAHQHMQEWVQAIQSFPSTVTLEINVQVMQIWRDYRSLRGVLAPIRARADYDVHLFVSEAAGHAWAQSYSKKLELAYTLAAFRGEWIARHSTISIEEAEEDIGDGTRGLRRYSAH